MSNRQNLDWFVNALCDQNNGTMGAEPRVRRTLTRRDNHLLINLWFLSQYLMKFNDIFHKYRTELFWFDVIIFVPLIRTEILHFSGTSLGGRTLGTPVYNSVIFEGATLVYRPDCNAEGGCHANSARAKRGRYWLWQPPEALQEGRYTSVAPEQNHAIIIITTWSHNVSSFYKLFACGSVPWGALV